MAAFVLSSRKAARAVLACLVLVLLLVPVLSANAWDDALFFPQGSGIMEEQYSYLLFDEDFLGFNGGERTSRRGLVHGVSESDLQEYIDTSGPKITGDALLDGDHGTANPPHPLDPDDFFLGLESFSVDYLDVDLVAPLAATNAAAETSAFTIIDKDEVSTDILSLLWPGSLMRTSSYEWSH